MIPWPSPNTIGAKGLFGGRIRKSLNKNRNDSSAILRQRDQNACQQRMKRIKQRSRVGLQKIKIGMR